VCGIVGIYEFARAGGTLDASSLVRMRDTLTHRGPDGQGLHISDDRRVGLGHRRLAIVDIEGGAQPMFGHRGEALVFNGEIYNYPDLRKRMQAEGTFFQTRCDTEIILRLYERYGEKCVEHLDGMFAFAIWDPVRERLVFARDRVGEKPFYWAEVDGRFLFASEIKALLIHPSIRPRVNERALAGYLANLVATTPSTLFEGISKLAPGEIGTCDRHGVRIRRYWDLLAPRRWRDHSHTASRTVRSLLESSIDARLMSDVPVGVLLSGGLDSTTLVALLRNRAKGLATFSVGFENSPALDEREAARRVAAHYGTDHHEVVVSESDAIGFLERLVHHQDEPLADPVCLPLHFVCELAGRSGVKVVLAGEGADELFWGYPRYRLALARWRWIRAALALPSPARRVIGRALPPNISPHRHERLASLASGHVLPAHFPLGLAAFDRQRLLRPHLLSGQVDGWRRAGQIADESLLDRFAFDTQEYEFALRLPELLLMRIDRFSMANSVEARVPFLAPDLVEFAYRLPLAQKIVDGQTKVALRAAIRDIVPGWVLERPKQGFGAPVAAWMGTRLGGVLRSMLREDTLRAYFQVDQLEEMLGQTGSKHFASSGSRRLNSGPLGHYHSRWQTRRFSILWPILNFGLWHKYWIEGESVLPYLETLIET
jgi:asparagine synthase (glutamine-hydrolysing)